MECGVEAIWRDWKTVRLLGEGSFGKVYEIERNQFGIRERSAVKIISIPASLAEVQSLHNDGMTERDIETYYTGVVQEFAQEISLMSKLRGHANIVGYEDYSVVEREDRFGWDIYIRMELLTSLPAHMDALKSNDPDKTVAAVGRQAKTFGVKDVVAMAIDLCSALEVCYQRHIVHRDIKPDNVFVSQDGTYKLGDFGVAKTVEKTVSGLSKKGTYTYMAPEIYKGEPGGMNADIYSLGIMIYKLLNDNREPFLPPITQGVTFADKQQALLKRMNGETFPPPKYGDGALWDIVKKACECDAKKRYQNPTQMKRDLENFARGETVVKPAPVVEKPIPVAVPQKPVEKPTPATAPQKPVEKPTPATAPQKPVEKPTPAVTPQKPVEKPTPATAQQKPVERPTMPVAQPTPKPTAKTAVMEREPVILAERAKEEPTVTAPEATHNTPASPLARRRGNANHLALLAFVLLIVELFFIFVPAAYQIEQQIVYNDYGLSNVIQSERSVFMGGGAVTEEMVLINFMLGIMIAVTLFGTAIVTLMQAKTTVRKAAPLAMHMVSFGLFSLQCALSKTTPKPDGMFEVQTYYQVSVGEVFSFIIVLHIVNAIVLWRRYQKAEKPTLIPPPRRNRAITATVMSMIEFVLMWVPAYVWRRDNTVTGITEGAGNLPVIEADDASGILVTIGTALVVLLLVHYSVRKWNIRPIVIVGLMGVNMVLLMWNVAATCADQMDLPGMTYQCDLLPSAWIGILVMHAASLVLMLLDMHKQKQKQTDG